MKIIITMPPCIKCNQAKIKLEANNEPYRLVEANSSEGQELIKKHGITQGGSIINLVTGEVE